MSLFIKDIKSIIPKLFKCGPAGTRESPNHIKTVGQEPFYNIDFYTTENEIHFSYRVINYDKDMNTAITQDIKLENVYLDKSLGTNMRLLLNRTFNVNHYLEIPFLKKIHTELTLALEIQLNKKNDFSYIYSKGEEFPKWVSTNVTNTTNVVAFTKEYINEPILSEEILREAFEKLDKL